MRNDDAWRPRLDPPIDPRELVAEEERLMRRIVPLAAELAVFVERLRAVTESEAVDG